MFRLLGYFTPVLALYDPFGVDVPLNFDITHSIYKAPIHVIAADFLLKYCMA